MKKVLAIILVLLIVGLVIFLGVRYFFVFGEGVKAGYIFKTYEGKLIQSGLRSKTPGTIQSYEFEFSISDEAVAQKLMLSGGKQVELHYKEYFGALPWRGYSEFVVDSIIAIQDLPVR
jgi:hypothetical protein